MADKKISQLSAASTPLAGTEVLPIVQSNATVKVATDNLTVKNIRSNATTGILQVAGPAASATRTMTTPDANFTVARTDAANSFTADQTLATGNLVVGTASKGVNFTANTPLAGMTSQLLNYYEEGTWTPSDGSGAGLTFIVTSATYTRIGRVVHCHLLITYPSTANGLDAKIAGAPFPASVATNSYLGSTASVGIAIQPAGSTNFGILNIIGAGAVPNSTLSGALVYGTFTYFT